MRHLSVGILLLAAACGGERDPKTAAAIAPSEVKSTDFALLPCAGHDASRPCVLVMAGGKRILMGAPGGVSETLSGADLAKLDSVLLFSLQAGDIEGLDEIRNRSWQAGREAPLPVSGPQGTRDTIGALNKAFEVADAQRAKTDIGTPSPKAAPLAAVAGERETKAEVFNSGDLIITHVQNADGWVGYWIDYDHRRAIIEPCGMTQASQFGGEADAALGCDGAGLSWPLTRVEQIEPRAYGKPASGADAIS